jgi:hypothetical protein
VAAHARPPAPPRARTRGAGFSAPAPATHDRTHLILIAYFNH